MKRHFEIEWKCWSVRLPKTSRRLDQHVAGVDAAQRVSPWIRIDEMAAMSLACMSLHSLVGPRERQAVLSHVVEDHLPAYRSDSQQAGQAPLRHQSVLG